MGGWSTTIYWYKLISLLKCYLKVAVIWASTLLLFPFFTIHQGQLFLFHGLLQDRRGSQGTCIFGICPCSSPGRTPGDGVPVVVLSCGALTSSFSKNEGRAGSGVAS